MAVQEEIWHIVYVDCVELTFSLCRVIADVIILLEV